MKPGMLATLLLLASANASAATGVNGRVMISPAHPGPQRIDESGSVPMQGASILVLDAQRSVVAHATTDVDGRFSVTVVPGEYSVEVDVGKARLPRCGTVLASVKDGEIAKVELECDSGMR
jgi:hypothetical protein